MPPKVHINESPCKEMPKFSCSEICIDVPHLSENEASEAFNVIDLQEQTWKTEAKTYHSNGYSEQPQYTGEYYEDQGSAHEPSLSNPYPEEKKEVPHATGQEQG